MAKQPQRKTRQDEYLAAAPWKIMELLKGIGFFPEDQLHPVAVHNEIIDREKYFPLTLSKGKIVDRYAYESPTVSATLVVIRSGKTWRITRAVLTPEFGCTLSTDEVRELNLKLAALIA